MSSITAGDRTLFNSTAAATAPPPSYISVPASDTLTALLDHPLGSWHSIILVLACVLVLAGCGIFLALRYIEVLSVCRYHNQEPPLTLEAQRPRFSAIMQGNAPHSADENFTSQSSPSPRGSQSDTDIRRRLRSRYSPKKKVVVGGVLEGRIAKRRASKSGSVDLKSTLAELEPI